MTRSPLPACKSQLFRGELIGAKPIEQRRTGFGEFLDRIDERVAVLFAEGDRQGEHAALGEPDAASQEIEIEEVAQYCAASLGVFLRADRRVGHMDREHRAEPSE